MVGMFSNLLPTCQRGFEGACTLGAERSAYLVGISGRHIYICDAGGAWQPSSIAHEVDRAQVSIWNGEGAVWVYILQNATRAGWKRLPIAVYADAQILLLIVFTQWSSVPLRRPERVFDVSLYSVLSRACRCSQPPVFIFIYVGGSGSHNAISDKVREIEKRPRACPETFS